MSDERKSWTDEEIRNALHQFSADKQIIISLLLDIKRQLGEVIDQLSLLKILSGEDKEKR